MPNLYSTVAELNYTYDGTKLATGYQTFYFFKQKYLNHTQQTHPTWKTLIYRTTNIMPKFNTWLTYCIDLNTLKQNPGYVHIINHYNEQAQEENSPAYTNPKNLLDLLKTQPALAKAIYKGISTNQTETYEQTLLQLLTKTNVKNLKHIYTLMALHSTPEQAKEYLQLPQHYINTLLET